jgi:hypothetical protein
MAQDVTIFRLYLMRAFYAAIFVLLGFEVWPIILGNHVKAWDPLHGVAFAFLGGMTLVAALALRYPLKMLPVLFLELLWKLIFVLAVAIPQWPALHATETTWSCIAGVIISLIVIPWPYVLKQYVMSPGDRWRNA